MIEDSPLDSSMEPKNFITFLNNNSNNKNKT